MAADFDSVPCAPPFALGGGRSPASLAMRFAPLPTLLVVSLMQIVLAGVLCFLALRASITHQRAAELYNENARLSDKTVPASTLRLQTEAVASSDRSLTACLFLSLGIAALAAVQLWLIIDLWKAASLQVNDGARQPSRTP